MKDMTQNVFRCIIYSTVSFWFSSLSGAPTTEHMVVALQTGRTPCLKVGLVFCCNSTDNKKMGQLPQKYLIALEKRGTITFFLEKLFHFLALTAHTIECDLYLRLLTGLKMK